MNEFIDTYSDDLLYLIDFRDSHLTHPRKRVAENLMYASLARIFSAFMIGSIETMIKYWRDRDSNNILDAYFQSGNNKARINSLKDNFKQNNISIDETILNKYLAIKYLRNSLIHSNWDEKQFVEENGFPTDTRALTENHLEQMYQVNIEMMKYIAAIENKEFSKIPMNNKLPKIKRYFTKSNLIEFLWHNMEQIDYTNQLDQEMVSEIIFNWKLFKELTIDKSIDIENLDKNFDFLFEIVSQKRYSDIPIGILNSEKLEKITEKDNDILDSFEKMLNLERTEIIPFLKAFTQAKKCYEIMINYSVSGLLKKVLDSSVDIKEYPIRMEYELAEKLFKFGRLYYDYAEKRE